jgi:hypothetical protein
MSYPGPFPIKVEQGGTGEIALAANAVLIGQTADDIGVTNVGTNGQVLLGATAAPPAFATLTSTGGTIVFTTGANTLNLEASGSTAASFPTDSGTAVPALGALTIAGGANIATSGAGSTVTIDLDGVVPIANGGTNASSMATTDGTIIFDGTRLVTTATGTSGQVLTSNGVGVAPTYQNVSASGAVTSVSGGNNITITGTATAPIVNVSGTTDHAVQVGNASGSLTSLSVGTTNTVLLGNTGADPSFGQVPNAALVNSSITLNDGANITVTGSPVSLGGSATIALSGVVPIANGGTNASSMATTDGTIIFDGTRLVTTATGTSGQVLTSNGAGVAPTYQNVSASGAVTSVNAGNNITITGTATAPIVNVSGTTNHAVQVGNSTNSLTSLSVGTNGQVLLGATSADPAFITPTAGTGLSITTNATTLQYALSTPVSIANGGTNATSMATTDGTVIFDGTRLVTTATGTSGQVLTSNGAGVAPTYQTAAASSISITGDSGGALTGNSFTFTGGTTGLTFAGAGSTETLGGTLVVSNGGTGITSATAYAVLCGGTTSTGAFQSIAGVGTSGQILTSNGAGALPTFQTASAGVFPWTEVTGASASMAINNGYIANNAGLVTLTLPSTAALGSIIRVTGKGAGGWRIAQNSGQTIYFGTSTTTTGTGGRLDSSAQRDGIELVVVTANNDWNVLSVQGNITVT